MNRFSCIKALALTVVLTSGLTSCGSPSSSGSTTSVTVTFRVPGPVNTGLLAAAVVPLGVASIRLGVTGEGMDPITNVFNVNLGETVTRLLLVPSGSGRLFTATAYGGLDAIGIPLFQGQSEPVDLEPGVPTTVIIPMQVLLISIAVTPLDPSIVLGLLEPFTATGTYGDGSTQDLTSSVDWGSSDLAVATISSGGLATSVCVGTTTVTATDPESSIGGSTDLTVTAVTPEITRLSLTEGVIGDLLKITGNNLGAAQGCSALSIGGVDATTILRWTDTEIAALVPSGVTVSSGGTNHNVLVTMGGEPSNLATVTLFDHTHGVGGETDDGDLDKLVLDAATTSLALTDLTSTDFGETSSLVLSGDGNTVAEADGLDYTERIRSFDTTSPSVDEVYFYTTQDVAISRDGTTALLADGTDTLILFSNNFTAATPTDTSITGPSGVCFDEVALSSDGNTAAAIGVDGSCEGAYHVYRIDDVLGTPTFTLISTAGSGAYYTDVAISEDGATVIVGRVRFTGTAYQAGVHRIRDFTTTPTVEADQAILASYGSTCPPDTVDVDITADGITAIVGIVRNVVCVLELHQVFQILDADIASANSAQVSTPPFLEGVAVGSGGAIAIVRVNDAPLGTALIRFDGFNLASPIATPIAASSLSALNITIPIRNQDQIDLQ